MEAAEVVVDEEAETRMISPLSMKMARTGMVSLVVEETGLMRLGLMSLV